ncbi:hypothetical protein AYR62_04335 [Secundilactobacillus paracollinoides]|uniref:copper homeostasis protein CutC n=1 Tax=Secundilactobacillus paracollinoides TaxID=240427 RepID=UPI0006D27109|nr:copper homeostasis protein CutC [Secundilactobacillus paracollinoides]ANZ63383.1 hypothetical protein AYR62_04335 [Secundilactobacillus paracollinoides]KRL79615.1 hypothetical protein FC17_GL000329 [Secundilactobacillus paracollinoides DSM 15502 = JCM 11969]
MIEVPFIENYTSLPETLTHHDHVIVADNRAAGGTTPSKGVLAEATLYVHDQDGSIGFLIKPRQGDYTYTDTELKIMEADLLEAQQLGADEVIFAATTKNHQLDNEAMANLIAAAGGMTVTLADVWGSVNAPDSQTFSQLTDSGVERVLFDIDTAEQAEWTDFVAKAKAQSLVPVPMSADRAKLDAFAQDNDLNLAVLK